MKASFPRSLSFYQLLLITFTRQFLPDIIRTLYYRGRSEARKTPAEPYHSSGIALQLTFGGMWRWRRVAVARVFALVVRSRVMMLFVYSRVGKNRDTSGGPRREPGQAAPRNGFCPAALAAKPGR